MSSSSNHRKLLGYHLIELDTNTHAPFAEKLPPHFVHDLNDNIEKPWSNFLQGVDEALRQRRTQTSHNKAARRVMFNKKMQQHVTRFNRTTPFLQIDYSHIKPNPGVKSRYKLTVSKFGEVRDRIPIVDPPRRGVHPPTAVGELVDNVEENVPQQGTTTRQEQAHQQEAIPIDGSVPIEDYVEAPVAATVVAVVEEEISVPIQQAPGATSTLARMQELESIRAYLTEEEFQNKRQAILEDI